MGNTAKDREEIGVERKKGLERMKYDALYECYLLLARLLLRLIQS